MAPVVLPVHRNGSHPESHPPRTDGGSPGTASADVATPAGFVAMYLGIGVQHLAGTSDIVLDILAARLMGDRRRAGELRLLLDPPAPRAG